MCVEPSEQDSFSKMMDLRNYMPSLIKTLNILPSILLETP